MILVGGEEHQVEKVDLAKDHMTMVYHINKKAKFSDGKPVTADDFVFSFDIIKDPGGPHLDKDRHLPIGCLTQLFDFDDHIIRSQKVRVTSRATLVYTGR